MVGSTSSDPERGYEGLPSPGGTEAVDVVGEGEGLPCSPASLCPPHKDTTLRSNANSPPTSGLSGTRGLLRNNRMRPFGVLSGDEAVGVVGAGWAQPQRDEEWLTRALELLLSTMDHVI